MGSIRHVTEQLLRSGKQSVELALVWVDLISARAWIATKVKIR